MNQSTNDNNIGIDNCRFAFRCTQTWDSLTNTEIESIRYCAECDRGVHLCKSDVELAEAISNNWCVAIACLNAAGEVTFPDRLLAVGQIATKYEV